ncbi:hypothetical protein NHX12_003959 [Muraenolepis orangiensis]|uniref:C2H2-type domain-containing protein n=1 Tax=Muraenolepis orangiensis TaxID=630683 RepID=A0A9Q0DUI9_9TELE|nr:hypothetical protein NHX12_003959 [Muraenolepis orangiensis]
MDGVGTLRAQVSSVIDALSKAAVAEISKVLEDGMVVLRMEICQRDDEILRLKGNIDLLHTELKATTSAGGRDHRGGSALLPGDDGQGPGSDDGKKASIGNMLDKEFPHKDRSRVSTPEVHVKREPSEEEECLQAVAASLGLIVQWLFSKPQLPNFTRRAHLERHKLIHTGEKPYVCEVCGRRFNQKSSVKEHMKIHQKGLQQKTEIQGPAERRHVPQTFGTDPPQGEDGSLSAVKDELPKDDTQLATDVPVKSGPEAKVATQPPNPCPSQPAREAIGDPGEDIRAFDRVGELWMPGPHVKNNPGTSNGVLGKNMPSVPGHDSLHPAPVVQDAKTPPLRNFNMSGKAHRNPGDNASSLQRYSSLGSSFGEGAMSANFNGMPWQPVDPHWARRYPSYEPAKPKKCFVCSFCCKVFERSGHLERHVRIHTGEKPYGCQICGRFFNQKGSLKIHLRTHRTGGCVVCVGGVCVCVCVCVSHVNA